MMSTVLSNRRDENLLSLLTEAMSAQDFAGRYALDGNGSFSYLFEDKILTDVASVGEVSPGWHSRQIQILEASVVGKPKPIWAMNEVFSFLCSELQKQAVIELLHLAYKSVEAWSKQDFKKIHKHLVYSQEFGTDENLLHKSAGKQIVKNRMGHTLFICEFLTGSIGEDKPFGQIELLPIPQIQK